MGFTKKTNIKKMMIFGLLLLHVSCTTASSYANIDFAEKRGNGSSLFGSTSFKSRYFKLCKDKDANVSVEYYTDEHGSRKGTLPISNEDRNIYWTTMSFPGREMPEDQLIMWSGHPGKPVKAICEAAPSKDGKNSWSQVLRVTNREGWIASLTEACQSFGIGIIEKHDKKGTFLSALGAHILTLEKTKTG